MAVQEGYLLGQAFRDGNIIRIKYGHVVALGGVITPVGRGGTARVDRTFKDLEPGGR
jgi:hypothetical protein